MICFCVPRYAACSCDVPDRLASAKVIAVREAAERDVTMFGHGQGATASRLPGLSFMMNDTSRTGRGRQKCIVWVGGGQVSSRSSYSVEDGVR